MLIIYYSNECCHARHEVGVCCQVCFDVYYAIAVDDWADGRNGSGIELRGVGNGRDGEGGSHLIFGQFIFEHVESHLQMLGIHNVEEGLAWQGSTIERVLNLRDST